MNDDFATAMRRSLEQTRAGNPAAATRLIQEALCGPARSEPAKRPSPTGAVEDAEVLDDAEMPTSRPPRRPLGQVISGLARRPQGLDLRRKPAVPAPPVPDGASFERRHYQGPQGARAYRLYLPASHRDAIRGVVLMLHGCTQTPEDFAAGTAMNAQAELHGLAVAYPEQEHTHNASLCWNWFRPSDQHRAAGEPAILAGLAGDVAREFAVPQGHVFAAGLSAGGAMAALLGETHPELFGAVGIHSGLAPRSAQDVVSAFAAMRGEAAPGAEPLRAPAIIFHGLADRTVAPVNADRIAGALTGIETRSGEGDGRRFRVTSGRSAAGHAVELWHVSGAGHAWSGGTPTGSYTDPSGPDASAEMIRFFRTQKDL